MTLKVFESTLKIFWQCSARFYDERVQELTEGNS